MNIAAVDYDSEAAALATSTPQHLRDNADAAIVAAHAHIDTLCGGSVSGLAALDEFDEAMAALANASDRLDLIAASHPDEAMRDAAESAKQELAKVRTDVWLDRRVYEALAELGPHESDRTTQHYVTTILREFRRSGVDRDEPTRARIRQLNEDLVEISQEFDRNIRTDTRAATFDPAVLDGLPDDYRRAHPAGTDGLVTITTDYPDLLPFLRYAHDAKAREVMFRLFRQRAYPANVDVFARMLARRHELATLLGYANWADYVAEDKMVGSADNISDFIDRIAAASARRCDADYATLLARKRVDDPSAERVYPWDTAYLDDRVKAEQLALDTAALRPYFEYTRVKAGLFGLMSRLFGVEFSARPDIECWHSDVECYDVLADQRRIGRIFLDMHPRPDKFNHAAMFSLTTGKAGRRIPECALLCNLPRPSAEEPALLQHSDVSTFFHEFGHLMHHIMSGASRWSGTSGIATEWDFVEAPSQLLEEWVLDPEVLTTFAVHHQTGEALPASVVDKLRRADRFGKGLFVRTQMFYASLSLEVYRRDPDHLDVLAVEYEAQRRFTPYDPVDGTCLYASFGHLDGYSAIYCTYMWSLVIAKDLFTAFAAEGLLSPDVARRYRDAVLAPGGGAPAASLVADFLGRPYEFRAYQEWLDTEG